ncbi:MarR family transcriptional regulator [Flavobacterium sp.]|uniref:MarR family winged helix-turn-helix transcriptional regulator n=1 Tax=Flavobacterium sp. TaxID=239 RepID=UPI00260AEA2B|nr:MarR family transcriptional regulator [Flavobacterium sp.]MDD3003799.1 MarR family transcriptional regulator [Flavobacterium sp.]
MEIEEIIKSNSVLPLAKKTLLNILFTHNLTSEKLHEVLKVYDLSAEQFNVLRILKGQKGNPINMSDIQERMIAKASNTTRLVDKLLLKDLCTRKVCPENRRKIEVLITPKGLQLLENVDPEVENFENKWAQKLNVEELTILNNLLEKLRNQ